MATNNELSAIASDAAHASRVLSRRTDLRRTNEAIVSLTHALRVAERNGDNEEGRVLARASYDLRVMVNREIAKERT